MKKVVETAASEVGPQRRKTADGYLLHCCCICGTVAPWGQGWSTYCSYKDIDDAAAIPKFCSEACRTKGGPKSANVTDEMKRNAKAAEWRPPAVVFRDATDKEKYFDALSQQSKRTHPPLDGGGAG